MCISSARSRPAPRYVIVRWYAEKMRPIIGRNIIVENKVGAIDTSPPNTLSGRSRMATRFICTATARWPPTCICSKNPSVDVVKEIRIAATLNRQPTMMVVACRQPVQNRRGSHRSHEGEEGKGDLRHFQSCRQGDRCDLQGAPQTAAVEVTYRTNRTLLNDIASGAIDYAMFNIPSASSQERNGRVRILAVYPYASGTPTFPP